MNKKGSNHIMFAGMKLYNPNEYIVASSNSRSRPTSNLPKLTSSVYLIPLKKPRRTQTAQTLESRSEVSNSEINFAYFRKNAARPDSRVHPEILPFLLYVSQKNKTDRSQEGSFTGNGVAFSASGTQMLSDETLEACRIVFPKPAFWKFYKSRKYATPFLVQQSSEGKKILRPECRLGEIPFRYGKTRTRVFLTEDALDLELEQRLNELDEELRGHPPAKKRKIQPQPQTPEPRWDLNHNVLPTAAESESEIIQELEEIEVVEEDCSGEPFSVIFKEDPRNMPDTASASSVTSTDTREDDDVEEEEATVVGPDDDYVKDFYTEEVDMNNNELKTSKANLLLQFPAFRPETPKLVVQDLIIFDRFFGAKPETPKLECTVDLDETAKDDAIKGIDLNNNRKDQRSELEAIKAESLESVLSEIDIFPLEDLSPTEAISLPCREFAAKKCDKSTSTEEVFARILEDEIAESVGTRHIDSVSILRKKRVNFFVETQQFCQESLRAFQSTNVPSSTLPLPSVKFPARRKSGSELTSILLPESVLEKNDLDSLIGMGYRSTVSESVILPAISRRKRLLNQVQVQFPAMYAVPPLSENPQREIGPVPPAPEPEPEPPTANSNVVKPKPKGMIRRCWMSIRSTFHKSNRT